jgi:hypothetical protein
MLSAKVVSGSEKHLSERPLAILAGVLVVRANFDNPMCQAFLGHFLAGLQCGYTIQEARAASCSFELTSQNDLFLEHQ